MKPITKERVKLPSNCYGREINGRPISPSIINGDQYKLRKQHEDIYNRVAKTVNIDYDPKTLKGFLKELAKKDSINKLRPRGMANESNFPTDLRVRYQFMLNPLV